MSEGIAIEPIGTGQATTRAAVESRGEMAIHDCVALCCKLFFGKCLCLFCAGFCETAGADKVWGVRRFKPLLGFGLVGIFLDPSQTLALYGLGDQWGHASRGNGRGL